MERWRRRWVITFDRERWLSAGILLGLFAFCAVITLAYFSLPAGKERPLVASTESFGDAALTFVSSTEYMPSEPVEVITRLTDMRGNVMPANCSLSIAYPDLSLWVNDTLMNYSSPFLNHYWQGTAQSQIGVYEIFVSCRNGVRSYNESKTFHVSNSTPYLAALINASAYNLTAYLAGKFNATDELIMNNLNGSNASFTQIFNNISSSLQIIINQLFYSCNGVTNFTTEGINASRLGEPFFIKAQILDACGHSLSNFSCSAQTGASFWGVVAMPYDSATFKYEYSIISDKSGIVSWQVNCN